MNKKFFKQFKERVSNRVKIAAGIKPEDLYPHTQDVILEFNHIKLYYWRPQWTLAQNFGDHLSKMIVARILASREFSLEEETSNKHRMFAIGSIMQLAEDNEVIWGSGVNGCFGPDDHKFKTLDVRAVRGRLTGDFLRARGIHVPEVYGDPALLLPYIFPTKFKRTNKLSYAVVPHHGDYNLLKKLGTENLIDPMGSWNVIISKILEADFIIASSLHGIIVAEAYGVPARYLRVSNNQDLFKYNDYMSGTGRGEIQYATTVKQALEMGGQEPIKEFDHTKLLDAFPFDLWASK
ncbi:polysaccharide pyruvyl transferase family protein [Hymenobacter sp. BT683]|uniref:Polysaccharide pyruvyl transferase family protein n=1 Tax=Hymenobacter jeongseonensis TaxID=2791027 RepID=A0ABS0IFQ4_9BACT|nr:polysaccharide pyruvyl transferase family protein [Hymenobacter jeongseonensis]MBF9236753.1 polysaccharide pyruvyl transferase family protein [Hymenobacter jeongseonensis]